MRLRSALAVVFVVSVVALGTAALIDDADGASVGRDESGRVLTGSVIDLGDFAIWGPGRVVVVGETPWGAVMACPDGGPQVTAVFDFASGSVEEVSEALAIETVEGFLRERRLVTSVASGDLYVVREQGRRGSSVIVAASWAGGAEEPVAAWFALSGTRISGYSGCSSFFGRA